MKKIGDGIRDHSSNSRVNQKLIAEVGRINGKLDDLRKRGMIVQGLRKISYQQLEFMRHYLACGDPEKAAFAANVNIKHKRSARKWGMKQLENPFVQTTIKKALEGESRLSPDKIAAKIGDAFEEAVTVNDIVKVAEYVTKARGEMNDGNKIGVNVGIGVIGGQSTEELEKQFAILTASGEEQPIGRGGDETSLLDEITI